MLRSVTVPRKKPPITFHCFLILNNSTLSTADLSWSSNISMKFRLKARKINVNQDVLKQLYLRPHLEYGCHDWNPHLEKSCRNSTWGRRLWEFTGTAQQSKNAGYMPDLGCCTDIFYRLSYFPEGTFKLRENTLLSWSKSLLLALTLTFIPHTTSFKYHLSTIYVHNSHLLIVISMSCSIALSLAFAIWVACTYWNVIEKKLHTKQKIFKNNDRVFRNGFRPWNLHTMES